MFETENKKIVPGEKAPVTSRRKVFIREISSSANIESAENLDENLYKYESRGDRYIAVPENGRYYDISESETGVIEEEMIVEKWIDVVEAVRKLTQFPFLLIDNYASHTFSVYIKDEQNDSPIDADPEAQIDYATLKSDFPEVADEVNKQYEQRYEFLRKSDLNKRTVREALYPLIADLEGSFADIIKKEYPKSEGLKQAVGRDAQRTWEETDYPAHISEFLNLSDMINLIEDSDELARRCGFKLNQSPPEDDMGLEDLRAYEVGSVLSMLRELRNKVMHANRAMVKNDEDIAELHTQIQFLFSVLEIVSEEFEVEPVE